MSYSRAYPRLLYIISDQSSLIVRIKCIKQKLDHDLFRGESLCERLHHGTGHKAEEQAEGDGDGQGGQCFAPDGQQQQGQAQSDQDGHETRDCRVPVSVAGRLAHQHWVEDKIAQTQLDSTWKEAISFIKATQKNQ